MTEVSELKPCPFCDSKADILRGFYAYCTAEECEAEVMGKPLREQAVAAWNRRAALAVAPKPRVRKLEWADTGPGYLGYTSCGASSVIGYYYVDKLDSWCVYFDKRLQYSGHDSADAAKAAAQADLERRILAALED